MLRLATSRDRVVLDVRAGKGSKQRAVPLTTAFARTLRRYVTHEPPTTSCPALFVTERSRFRKVAVTPASAWKRFFGLTSSPATMNWSVRLADYWQSHGA